MTTTVKSPGRSVQFVAGLLISGFVFLACTAANAEEEKSTLKKAQGASHGTAADQLTAILNPIKTFSAAFNQRVVDEQGTLIEDYRGEMIVAKPSKLYWVSAEPVAQTVVSDGTTIWFYDADLEQVTQQIFTEDFQSTPALLLGGDAAKISSQFSVTLVQGGHDAGAGEKSTGQMQRFLLHPSAENAMFDSLALDIVGGKIKTLEMHDSLGQVTTIEFSNIKTNISVAQERFTFVAPPGVEIIVDE